MSGADITLINLNMLYLRHMDGVERERHLPLGPLYLAAALEQAGFTVDFRDYQQHEAEDPFSAARHRRLLRRPGADHRPELHGEPAALHHPRRPGAARGATPTG